MKYSNEVKVGIAIVVAALAFFFGVRFFQDIPLFRGSYVLYAEFEDASGLVAGNPVQVNGVGIGQVEAVRLDPQGVGVNVSFRVDEEIQLPQGSSARIEGISALSGVKLAINMGPPSNPPVEPGSILPSPPSTGLLSQLTETAPGLISRADTVLASADVALSNIATQLSDPQGSLNQTLEAIRSTAASLEGVTTAQEAEIEAILGNLSTLTTELSQSSLGDSDSLDVTVTRVNQALARLNNNLQNLENTTQGLGSLLEKINQGEGTLGRLVNDESLYTRLDSAALQLNRILEDLQENPERYLEDMTLVKVF